MIEIHYDYTDGTEVSYEEGLKLKDNFTTNCLIFFNTWIDVDDVIVVDKKGNILSRQILMDNSNNKYTYKHMSKSHDICKMLISNSFNWRTNHLRNGLIII